MNDTVATSEMVINERQNEGASRYSSRTKIDKVVQIILFVMMAYSTTLITKNYLERNSDTTVDVTTVDYLHFPAVTICNLNAFKRDTFCLRNSSTRHLCKEQQERSFVRHFVKWLKRQNTSESSGDYSSIIKNLSREIYSIDEMIIQCVVVNQDCSDEWFRSVGLPVARYGECVCLFCGMKQRDIPRSDLKVGIELLLYNDMANCMLHSNDRGYLVMVHNPDSFPDANNDGVFVSPGLVTNIGISEIQTHHLEAPIKTDCRTKWPSHLEQVHNLETIGYSSELCVKLSTNIMIIQACACSEKETLTQFGIPYQELLDADGICVDENETVTECYERALEKPKEYRGCDCPRRCRELRYQRTVSLVALTPQYAKGFENHFRTGNIVSRNLTQFGVGPPRHRPPFGRPPRPRYPNDHKDKPRGPRPPNSGRHWGHGRPEKRMESSISWRHSRNRSVTFLENRKKNEEHFQSQRMFDVHSQLKPSFKNGTAITLKSDNKEVSERLDITTLPTLPEVSTKISSLDELPELGSGQHPPENRDMFFSAENSEGSGRFPPHGQDESSEMFPPPGPPHNADMSSMHSNEANDSSHPRPFEWDHEREHKGPPDNSHEHSQKEFDGPPPDPHSPDFIHRKRILQLQQQLESRAMLRQLSKIKIYFTSLGLTVRKERPKVSTENMIDLCGGFTSMFLGISALSLIEVIMTKSEGVMRLFPKIKYLPWIRNKFKK